MNTGTPAGDQLVPFPNTLTAGAAYFAIVFAAGFALGAARVVVIAPALGELGAVLVELPLMLVVSWLACRWLARRFVVPAYAEPRAVMGGLAFALLMLAESAVSVFALGRTPTEHWNAYRSAPALAGFAGQLAFAAFPLVQAVGRQRTD